jgi:hypothetical protein
MGRRDRIGVGFSTTYAISAYHHYRCELESGSGKVYSIQHYMIKFVSHLRQSLWKIFDKHIIVDMFWWKWTSHGVTHLKLDLWSNITMRNLFSQYQSAILYTYACMFKVRDKERVLVFNATFWWRKPEYQEKTTDLSQVTDKNYRVY